MARSRKSRKAEESSENVARKIWLAGLGAYGKSLEDAQGQLDKASQEASRKSVSYTHLTLPTSDLV